MDSTVAVHTKGLGSWFQAMLTAEVMVAEIPEKKSARRPVGTDLTGPTHC
jgi:hypothetical protein